ncbi:MAG: hypothetical protein ABTQ93_04870 [Candidatus Competibacter denitrificans]
MRLLLLLVVLAIIGLTLVRWLDHGPPAPKVSGASEHSAEPPKVPTRPQDVKAFEADINRFIKDSAAQRVKQESAP